MLILVVDDDPVLRTLFKDVVETWGPPVDVRACQNGREAWELIRRGIGDGIISDLTMPVMSGEELLRRVRHRGLYLPFLLTSALPGPQTRRVAQRLAAGFLAKPFGPARIHDWLDLSFAH